MTKIYTPNKGYTGIVAGISFVKGVGETDNGWLINWFEEKGYEIDEKKTIDKMTLDELKIYAEANEIDLGEAKLKADVLAIIKGGQ